MDALIVARCFIGLACKNKMYSLNNLKLQKLLYYAQGIHLVWNEVQLFDEEIEACTNGPVVPEIFKEFSKYRNNEIDYSEGIVQLNDYPVEMKTIEAVWRKFRKMKTYEIVDRTQNEHPWKDTYGNMRIINIDLINKIFKENFD